MFKIGSFENKLGFQTISIWKNQREKNWLFVNEIYNYRKLMTIFNRHDINQKFSNILFTVCSQKYRNKPPNHMFKYIINDVIKHESDYG